MAKFAVQVTQFHGNVAKDGTKTYTGHVNVTFLRDGKSEGTYGSNVTGITGVQLEDNQ